jgi:hypothetical protein
VQFARPAGGDGHAALNALGTVHVCFTVDDLDAAYRQLGGRGVYFVNPPATGTSRRWLAPDRTGQATAGHGSGMARP